MKTLISDLDGTLLRTDHTVSQATIEALRDWHDSGGEFIIATGRAYFEVEEIAAEIGIPCPLICMNGALIMNQQEIIYSKAIDREVVNKVLPLILERQFNIDIITKQVIYKVGKIERLLEIFKSSIQQVDIDMLHEAIEDGHVRLVDENDIPNILETEIDYIYKIIAYSANKEKLQELKTQAADIDGIEVTSAVEVNIEMGAKGVSKGEAVKRLSALLDFPLESTVAIGDNHNDVSMFDIAGTSIAMGNATDDIKRRATVVTDVNDCDGLAKAIRTYFLP
ncbi:MAG: Cof-type HAD-IIB family hydrolase [Bacillus sp. (in: firmicutes)]